ncbi:hypothetical protein ABPG77_002265 [Micractinium sp. CCAP 211/92]
MQDPRHLLREARELKLSERGEGSSPASPPRRAAQPPPSVDLEAPLLEGSQLDGSSPKLSDGRGAASGGEEQVLEDRGAAHAHPGLHHRQLGRRDSRDLWRLARRQMGLSYREDPDAAGDSGGDAGYVVRVRPGAQQPAPSWQRAPGAGQPGSAAAVADLFVEMLTGKGLGTGAALRTPASLIEPEAPGMCAPLGDAKAVAHMLTSSWLNLLLICLPIGLWAGLSGGDPSLVFTANFLALIPLALFLGEVTEDLAARFGDTAGGLLNATFGNVVELVLSVSALRRGLYEVVSASLLGSILSNQLLVLGTCFFVGGIKYKEQRFSTFANKVSSSLLFLACIGILIPSTARMVYGKHVITGKVLLNLSHVIAILLVVIYLCYLFFQLNTHVDLFQGEGDDEEVPALSLSGALFCLTAITLIVTACSEFLTGAIQAVSASSGINEAFLGLIVLPIAGNVAEHVTAVFVAAKNKMDLSIAVALGSSTQVAIFIVPLVVLVGWAMGAPFTLDFDPFCVLLLLVSVILAYFITSDGASNWLLGLQLITTYFLIGFVFFLEKEAPRPGPKPAASPPPAAAL